MKKHAELTLEDQRLVNAFDLSTLVELLKEAGEYIAKPRSNNLGDQVKS